MWWFLSERKCGKKAVIDHVDWYKTCIYAGLACDWQKKCLSSEFWPPPLGITCYC